MFCKAMKYYTESPIRENVVTSLFALTAQLAVSRLGVLTKEEGGVCGVTRVMFNTAARGEEDDSRR